MSRKIGIGVWIAFWTIAYFVLLGMFSSSSRWLPIDHIYTAIFMITLMMAVAWSEFYRRRFLLTRSYKLWLINVYGVIMIGALFNEILFEYLIDFILPGYYFISYYSFWDIAKFFIAFIVLATMIGLSMEWFQLQEEKTTLATGKLNNLINQVNPHFLFNGLTVLYSLSLKDSKETSSAIIKLSDILRYVIYQPADNTVKLSSETAVLRDYIDLQRYRVHPSTQIDFVYDISNDLPVAPMLFLPLVENAFKHGVHGETENAFVKMSLLEKNGVVIFNIENNKSSVTKASGIGLKNLRERLDLLYPGKHSFTITETENRFNVEMRLHDSGR